MLQVLYNEPKWFSKWLNLLREKRWIKDEDTKTWTRKTTQTLNTPKVWIKKSCIKKTWKILLFTWRNGLFFYRGFDQSDTNRSRERKTKKRSDSRSWLTALINKSVAKEWALCISSLSLWGLSCDNREMQENNSWLLKQILYSPSGCIHVCSCRIFLFFLMRIFNLLSEIKLESSLIVWRCWQREARYHMLTDKLCYVGTFHLQYTFVI